MSESVRGRYGDLLSGVLADSFDDWSWEEMSVTASEIGFGEIVADGGEAEVLGLK